MTGLLFLVACFLVLGWCAQSKVVQTFQIHGIEYIGVPDTSRGSSLGNIGPVYVKKITHPLELNSLDTSFQFMTQEPTFSYGNLFQTGDTLDAIRMELQPSSNLVLVLGEGKLFPLSNAIQIGKYHNVHLKYERNHLLKVFIDKTEVLNITDKGVLAEKLDISNIVVGTGLGRQRALLGSVKSFNLNGAYSYYDRTARLSRWMFIFLCGIAFLMTLPRGSIAEVAGAGDATPTTSDIADNIAIYGLSLVFVAMGLFSIRCFGEQHLGLSKWLAHLMLPVSIAATLFVVKPKEGVWKWVRWPLGVIFLAYDASIVALTGYKTDDYDAFILDLFLFSFLAFALPLARNGENLSLSKRASTRLTSGFAIGITGLFLALSWSTLVDLTNWSAFRQALDNNFGVSVVGAFLLLRAVFAVLFGTENSAETTTQSLCNRGKLRYLDSRLYLDMVIIAIFFWISFRHDSLFIPGSEYHWEYYVGVVQGIRNGGWLLWDTPSQYGFLNVLLASLVPSASAWQSFYIFQGTLLFLVSTGIYLTARRYTSLSVFHRLAVFAIVFMALFFADPELIGPYPFPSSSVVRFFCVYALVLVVWFVPKFGLRQAIAISIAWSLGVIWSAESAIYVTAIFFFMLVAMTQASYNGNHPLALAGKYVLIAGTSLAIILTVTFVFYFARLGVVPDIFGFFEHAFGYAGGFGYVPFPLSGPGNLLVLVFMGVSILCIGVIQRGGDANEYLAAPLAAMAGGIWGISTYYIGRPVPQNITAMLPLIAMVTYFTYMASKRMNLGMYSLPIKAAAIPIIFLVLVPLINFKWISDLGYIQSFTSDITSKLPKANDELQQLLSRAKLSAETPIIYYGDEAAPPILTGDYARFNETNWLPIPLQLLEQPVSQVRKSQYLKRYICRNQPGTGIIVLRKGDAIAIRLQGFLNELSQFYVVEEVASGNVYSIYRFSGMSLYHCPTVVGKKTS
jgi:hypothetical protein